MRRSRACARGLLALLALAPLAGLAREPAKCSGTVSGKVTATFACSAMVVTQDGQPAFVLTTPEAVEGVPSVVPGSFLLPGEPAARTYTLDDLGYGKASVAAEGGALYTAAKTTGRRGEVALTFRSIAKSRTTPGVYDVHGSYRARLLRVGGASRDEVVLDVKF